MIPTYYAENLSARLYQEYSAKLHRQRLEKIKHRPQDSLNLSIMQKKAKDSKKIPAFTILSKSKEVMRENKLLYDRLTHISERKLSIDKPVSLTIPKTLNYVHRRKETEKIIKENQEFIQRLIEKPSHISLKKLKLDYELIQKYKENMSKKKILDRIQKLVKVHAMPTLEEVGVKDESSPEIKKNRASISHKKNSQSLNFSIEENLKPSVTGEKSDENQAS